MDLMGGRAGVFALPLENDFHFRTLLRVLQTAFPFPGFTKRIQLLSGATYALQILTLLCLENDLCADAFAVRTLTSHSWRLSRRWRQLFQDFWHGAEIDEAYGVSEVAGLFARRCPFCQHLHFSRLAFVEVLDLKTPSPSQTRIGRLVATSLWPLAEVQPLIRYDTGDIVEDHGCCPDTKRHSFEFLGRCHHIIWDDKDEPLLTSMQIEEAVDDFPDIAIEPMPVCAQLNLRQPVGWKKYAVHRSAKHETITISVDVELRWPPSQYPDKAAEFTRCVQNSLLANAPLLKQRHSEGRVRLEITLRAPGTSRHCALR
jgi:phenylacetate-coenzyme A ligase PaaK-like adenylate-forming protein